MQLEGSNFVRSVLLAAHTHPEIRVPEAMAVVAVRATKVPALAPADWGVSVTVPANKAAGTSTVITPASLTATLEAYLVAALVSQEAPSSLALVALRV